MNPSTLLAILCFAAFACVALAADHRFDDMQLEADRMVRAMSGEEDENAVVTEEEKKEVSALQQILANLIERIRVRVEEKHQSAQDLLAKVREVVERLNQLHARKTEKVQALLERLHGRIKELVSSLIDKLTGRPRTLRAASDEDLLEELKLDQLLLKTFVMTAAQQHQDESRVRREASDSEKKNTFEAIKEMFANLAGHLFGRYQEFMEWLTTVWKKGIEQAKGHHARLLAIAKEVIADAKDMHRETLREALEILRPYKEELGSLWGELVDAVNKALKN